MLKRQKAVMLRRVDSVGDATKVGFPDLCLDKLFCWFRCSVFILLSKAAFALGNVRASQIVSTVRYRLKDVIRCQCNGADCRSYVLHSKKRGVASVNRGARGSDEGRSQSQPHRSGQSVRRAGNLVQLHSHGYRQRCQLRRLLRVVSRRVSIERKARNARRVRTFARKGRFRRNSQNPRTEACVARSVDPYRTGGTRPPIFGLGGGTLSRMSPSIFLE